jgi:lysophospholipase L1-like esterase
MVLGDSLTWGAGLEEHQRYSNLLESELGGRGLGRSIEVLNFGIPGGPTVRERDVLRDHITTVAPDLVVVGFCVNDPQPRREDYASEIEHYRGLYQAVRLFDRLSLPHTASFLGERVTLALRRLGKVPAWYVALDRAYEETSPEWQSFVQALRDIRANCEQQDLPPPVFVPLLCGNGDYGHPNTELSYNLKWTRRAAEVAAGCGFQVVCLEDEFIAEGDRVRWVNPWDGHPSRECNVTYARCIADAIAPVLAQEPGRTS